MSKERFKLQLMLKHRLISSLTFKFEEKKLIFKRESVRKKRHENFYGTKPLNQSLDFRNCKPNSQYLF